MRIYATFANRKYDPELIELVHAWDEGGLEENPSGYEDTKAAELASWGDDLLRSVTVEIDVEMGDVYEALQSVPVSTRGHVKHIATNPPPDNRDPAGCANEESADV